jgi:adhesin transport system outer membrane protein
MSGLCPARPAWFAPGRNKALRWLAAGAVALGAAHGAAAAPPDFDLRQIPEPTGDPLRIDFSKDPILRLSERTMPYDEFRSLVAAALARHPGRLEAAATEDEARAAVDEARERLLPSGEITVSSYKTLSREFSDDPFNIIERSRPTERTDALVRFQQTLFDFGALSNRIHAASARLRAASAGEESIASQLAVRAIASWYDVVAYQALTEVSEEFAAMQNEFRAATEERIRQGVSAEGDLARVESYIASAETRRAQLTRALAQAEARFEELTGTPPAPSQPRAPVLEAGLATRDDAIASARTSPAVRAAEAEAEAARQDFRAIRSESLPNVTAGLDAGRYGVLENDRDYDVRASVTMRYRFFGGAEPRVDQVEARSRSVAARADRIRQEAERDASIAWSDVQALEAELAALRESYIASRRSRDVLFERFRVSRGTLFDVLEANDSYFETAVAYVQALSELDAARYVLLMRTGRLLDALDIDTEQLPGSE